MSRILILYHSTDGQTRRICARIQQRIQQLDASSPVVVQGLESFQPGARPEPDKIVLGASIRYGHHHQSVLHFIERHRAWLEARPSAFFSVNVVARKPGKDRPHTNPYLTKFLRQIDWRPGLVEVFAGRINYSLYGFWDRQMIRLIMWLTKGPTDPATDIEFTDWARVDRFAAQIAELENPAA